MWLGENNDIKNQKIQTEINFACHFLHGFDYSGAGEKEIRDS